MTDNFSKEQLFELQKLYADLKLKVDTLEKNQQEDSVCIVCTSNDLDKLMPALMIATGAASSGMKANIFFTLWGTLALRKQKKYTGKSILEKMFMMMTPTTISGSGLSKMNMGGIGSFFMKKLMKKHNVASLNDLLEISKSLNVDLKACQMTMGLMGITRDELIDGLNYCGVAAFIEDASKAKVTLFIG